MITLKSELIIIGVVVCHFHLYYCALCVCDEQKAEQAAESNKEENDQHRRPIFQCKINHHKQMGRHDGVRRSQLTARPQSS